MVGHKIKDGKQYYIMDAKQCVGNCVLWWALGNLGYTCDIDKAQVYEADEAREICSHRDTDIPFEVQSVRSVIVHHVRREPLYDLKPMR